MKNTYTAKSEEFYRTQLEVCIEDVQFYISALIEKAFCDDEPVGERLESAMLAAWAQGELSGITRQITSVKAGTLVPHNCTAKRPQDKKSGIGHGLDSLFVDAHEPWW